MSRRTTEIFLFVIWLAVLVIVARAAHAIIIEGSTIEPFLKPLVATSAWAIAATIRYFWQR